MNNNNNIITNFNESSVGTSTLGGVGMDHKEMSMGVNLASRPITTYSERDGRSEDRVVSNSVVQESPWTLNNMLERFAFLNTYQWLSSQPSHTVLSRLRIPHDLLHTSISSAPFQNFVFWKGDVEVNFQVTSTPLTQGMLAAVFVPLSGQRFIDSTIVPNFSNVSLNQVVYMYANTNTAAKMRISYNSPQAYIDLTDDLITTRNALGYLYLIVFNPIELAATASDTSSVSIFTRFVNNEFKVPRVSSVTSTFNARPQAMSMLASAATSILTQHKQPPSSGKKTVLRQIANKLIPSGLVGDVIDNALGVFGLDKPIDPNLNPPSKLIGTQYMNFAQGVETIDKLSLYPAQTYESTHETFASSVDEMDYNFLKKKYTYLGSFNFSTASTVGQVVASWPINPLPVELFNMETLQVPLLSYISVPFQYWKGGLTYKIQVVSTSFQTGKLFFAFNMRTFTPAVGFTIGQLTSQYGQAYELNQGSNELEFTVPYVANTPYLDVPNSNIPSIEDTVGYINVVVINPLVAPNNTPLSVTLNVYIAGADDFELSTLTQSNNLIPVQPLQLAVDDDEFEVLSQHNLPLFSAKPQSSAAPLVTPLNEVNLAEETLVAPNLSTEPRVDTTQLAPLTVRNLLKKYQMVSNMVYVPPTGDVEGYIKPLRLISFFGGQYLDSLPTPQDSLQPCLGVWQHYQLLYRQFKGPLRFKVMLNEAAPNASFSIFYQPPVSSPTPVNPAMVNAIANSAYFPPGPVPAGYNGRTNYTRVRNYMRVPVGYVNALQKTAEFEIPFSSKFLSILSWSGGASENELDVHPLTDLGTFFVYVQRAWSPDNTTPVPLDVSYQLNWFLSIGDESRLGTLYQIPLLGVNSTVDGGGTLLASTWPDSYGTGSPPSNTLTRL